MEKTVEERLKALVASHLYVELEQVTSEASFIEDLGADSLDIVDLAMAIEDQFSLQIKDEDYLHLLRVNDAVAYIERRLSEPAPEPPGVAEPKPVDVAPEAQSNA